MEAQQVLMNSVKILLERFGLCYSMEQLEVMRKRSMALFHFAEKGLKQFETSVFKVSPMIKILSIGGGGGGGGGRSGESQSKITNITDLEFVHCLATTIGTDLINKASKENSITGDSLESKLYQLVSGGHLVPLEAASITNKTSFNNCMVINHEKKLAYFPSNIPVMIEEIGNLVMYVGKMSTTCTTVKDKTAFIRKKAEDFQREIINLSQEYPTLSVVVTTPLSTIIDNEEKIDVFSIDGAENQHMQVEKEKTIKKMEKKTNEKDKRKKEKKEKERKKKKEKKEKKRKDKKKKPEALEEVESKKKPVVEEKKKRKREEEEKSATDPMKEKKGEVIAEMGQGREKVPKIDPAVAATVDPIPIEIIPEAKATNEMEISKHIDINIEEVTQGVSKIVLTPETPFDEKTQWFNSYLLQLREIVLVV